MQGGTHRHGRRQASNGVGDGIAHTVALLSGSRNIHDTGEPLHNLVICRLRCKWTGLAKPGNCAIDQGRIDGFQGIKPEAKSFHDARSEVLNNGIRGVDELFEYANAVWMFEIERDGLFSSILGKK